MYKDLKFLMNENRTYILTGLPNHSSPHTKASMMSGSKPLKVGLIVIVSILKAEFDIEVDIGIAKISRAILQRVGNFVLFVCHQPNMSNSPSKSGIGSSKYRWSSALCE